jgi:hypothetical protein
VSARARHVGPAEATRCVAVRSQKDDVLMSICLLAITILFLLLFLYQGLRFLRLWLLVWHRVAARGARLQPVLSAVVPQGSTRETPAQGVSGGCQCAAAAGGVEHAAVQHHGRDAAGGQPAGSELGPDCGRRSATAIPCRRRFVRALTAASAYHSAQNPHKCHRRRPPYLRPPSSPRLSFHQLPHRQATSLPCS